MLNLKKTAVAVLAFSSSAVFAGTMGPVCTPGSVTVPCEHTAWDFGAQALYLQPTHGSEGNFTGVTTSTGATVTSSDYNSYPAKWIWGFMIEGSYHFSTGNDLNVNWYHLNGGTGTSVYNGPTFTRVNGATTDATLNDSAKRNDKWDAVNIEFGQHVDFGEWQNIRFHGGAQFARIQHNTTNYGSVTPVGAPFTLVENGSHTFSGFGPRVGTDYSYDWGNGLAMYAKGGAAVLVGTSKFNGAVTRNPGTYNSFNASHRKIVPELEAKLGGTYTYAMAQGDLTLDVGWMFVNYFDVHTHVTSATNVADTNWAAQGPYFGLNWVGNV